MDGASVWLFPHYCHHLGTSLHPYCSEISQCLFTKWCYITARCWHHFNGFRKSLAGHVNISAEMHYNLLVSMLSCGIEGCWLKHGSVVGKPTQPPTQQPLSRNRCYINFSDYYYYYAGEVKTTGKCQPPPRYHTLDTANHCSLATCRLWDSLPLWT